MNNETMNNETMNRESHKQPPSLVTWGAVYCGVGRLCMLGGGVAGGFREGCSVGVDGVYVVSECVEYPGSVRVSYYLVVFVLEYLVCFLKCFELFWCHLCLTSSCCFLPPVTWH